MKRNWKQPPPAPGNAADFFGNVAEKAMSRLKEKRGATLLTTKDLAQAMALHVRTVKRWWKKLNVPPLVAGNCSHRWTYKQAVILIDRWAKYHEKHRRPAVSS